MSAQPREPKEPQENGREARVPLRLSMDSPEPMYAQIESQLRDFILGGELPEGTKLPSVRGLAKELACSVITTRRAYEDLERDGLVRTRRGLGTVVAGIAEGQRDAYRREPVAAALRKAVEAGRRAGFSEEELRGIFEETLGDEKDTSGGGQ